MKCRQHGEVNLVFRNYWPFVFSGVNQRKQLTALPFFWRWRMRSTRGLRVHRPAGTRRDDRGGAPPRAWVTRWLAGQANWRNRTIRIDSASPKKEPYGNEPGRGVGPTQRSGSSEPGLSGGLLSAVKSSHVPGFSNGCTTRRVLSVSRLRRGVGRHRCCVPGSATEA